MTTEIKTPPAATEGVNYSGVAGKQPNANGEVGIAQAPRFFDSYGTLPPLAVVEDLDSPRVSDDAADSELTLPPGLIGELAKYIHDSALYPMKEAALLAAFGLTAGIAGRCFNYKGTGLNLYMLLVAISGRGKEDMSRGISRLVAAVRPSVPLITDSLGPARLVSGQALFRKVSERPCFVWIQDEFGITLKNLNDPRAPEHLRVLRQVMLDLYGKSGRWDELLGSSYADSGKDMPSIQSPCLTILGASTPKHVFESLSYGDIEDGLLPRCLILECDDLRPDLNPNAGERPDRRIVERLAALAELALKARSTNHVEDVQATPDAAALLQRLSARLDADFRETNAPAERALWNRAFLNIIRVASLIAVGCNPYKPTIEAEHAQWAIDFVYRCVHGLAKKFRAGLVGTGEGRQEGELRKFIAEYVKMTPEKRRSTYKVPAAICTNGALVGMDYLRRRARQNSAFSDDRRGMNMALDSALRALERSGYLVKLSPKETRIHFNLTSDIYSLGSG